MDVLKFRKYEDYKNSEVNENISVLWLTPDKPENISVGRKQISKHLKNKGIDVTLKGTTIKTILRSIYEINKYDVIIGTTRSGAIVGTLLSLIHNNMFLVDHIDPIRQFKENNNIFLSFFVKWLENLSFYVSDHVFYVYKEEEKRVKKFSSSSSQVSLGVEYELFANPPKELISEVKSELKNYNLKDNIAIYIGGLEPIYHIKELLNSIEYLDNWSLLILGAGSMEEYVENIGSKNENIIFLGTVPHKKISGYLHISDVGISLVDDPNTLKILEYSASGLSIVQLKGRAEKNFNELVSFCSTDSKSIAKNIKEANKKSKEEKEKFKDFAKKYDWTKISDKYLQEIINYSN